MIVNKHKLRIIFNIKGVLIFLVCLTLLLAVVVAGVLINQKIDDRRLADRQNRFQAQIDRLSKEEKAIRRAQGYLKTTITQVEPLHRLFLEYLQRKFSLDGTLGISGPPIDLYEDPRSYPQEIHFLARIAYPKRLVKQDPKSLLEPVAIMSVYSANCDHLEFPKNYWQIVQQNIDAGGYELTHVALALRFLEENRCAIPKNIQDQNEFIIDGLVTLINDPTTIPDLRYEAIAFLMLHDQHSRIKQTWIDQIISEQLKDGGWRRDSGSKESNDHTTILAFWALLEYSRPNTLDEPIIRRPNQ